MDLMRLDLSSTKKERKGHANKLLIREGAAAAEARHVNGLSASYRCIEEHPANSARP